jgi:glycosyltransferase involved in cell wall biosynthesis
VVRVPLFAKVRGLAATATPDGASGTIDADDPVTDHRPSPPIAPHDVFGDAWRQRRLRQMVDATTQAAPRAARRLKLLMRLLPAAYARGDGIVGALSGVQRVVRRDGLGGLKRALARLHAETPPPINRPGAYREWVRAYDVLDDDDRAQIRRHIAGMPRKPLISVVLPVYDPHPAFLDQAIRSVRGQLYPHWELCIADDASTDPEVRRVIERHRREDSRIKVDYRQTNGHICRSTNSALKLAHGELVALLDHDDVVSEHALYWVAAELERYPTADIIYSDSDLIDDRGNRSSPYFKTNFNLELMLGHNMVSHFGVYRRTLVESVGGMRVGLEGSQDYDLFLRTFARSSADRVRHIPAILYHWRRSDNAPTFSARALDRCVDAAHKAIGDFLSSRNIAADVMPAPQARHFQRIAYRMPDPAPKVSVIIPTRNQAGLLGRCVQGVLSKTDYPALEVTIVDNGSDDAEATALLAELAKLPRVRVISYPGSVNVAAINNHAVGRSDGDILAFLDNDIEVTHRDWLREMVSRAARPEIGAVGAKLHLPNGAIQHAGIVTGLGADRVAGHAYLQAPRSSPGTYGDLFLAREVSAVTGACMVLRRSVFLEVGGLDDVNLAVSFNDVDLCLRLRERGYTNIVTPFAELMHHDSASRGADVSPDKRARFLREADYMRRRWGDVLLRDPYFSPNYSLDFQVPHFARPPRVSYPWTTGTG